MPRATGQFHGSSFVFAAHGGGAGADDSAGRCAATYVAFWSYSARGLRSRWILRAGTVCGRIWVADVHCETWLLGAGGAVQCGETRLDGRDRRMPKRRGDLHWMYDAGVSGQVHAIYESAAWFATFFGGSDDVWPRDSCVASIHPGVAQ